jgi:hypothetical protein
MFVGRGGSTFVSNTHHEIRRGSDGRGRPHRKNYLRWTLDLLEPVPHLSRRRTRIRNRRHYNMNDFCLEPHYPRRNRRSAIRSHPDSAESQNNNVTIRVLLSSCTQPVDSLSFVVNELLTALNV